MLLLDEMEKAHPGVQDVFYQVFDKGMMTDGEGREIDFRATVIIMTSNAGTDLITKLCGDPETAPDAIGLVEALRPELMKHFKPAFLGRTTLVPYLPLPADIIRRIITMQLERVGQRVAQNYAAAFDYSESVVDAIADRYNETASGARNVENILARTLLPELSSEILSRPAKNSSIQQVTVVTDADGTFAYKLR